VGLFLRYRLGFIVAGFAALSTLGGQTPDIAHAEAQTPAAQIYPIISLETKLARDESTFDLDKALDLACRNTGDGPDTCLCVTHVLKFELTLPEYQAATKLYGIKGDRSEIHQSLKDEGLSPSDISTAEKMERTLTQDSDFSARCAEAKAYYKK